MDSGYAGIGHIRWKPIFEVRRLDNLISIIILVLPGLIGYFFLGNIGPAENKDLSDYEKTVTGLMLNVPGLIIVWAIVCFRRHQRLSLSKFLTILMNFPDFIYYLLSVLFISVILAAIWNFGLKKLFGWFVNFVRKTSGRALNSEEMPWEGFIGGQLEGLMRIYPLGEREKFILGIIKVVSVPGGHDNGILLSGTEQLKELDDHFVAPLRTYVDPASQMVYQIFPATALDDALRRDDAAT